MLYPRKFNYYFNKFGIICLLDSLIFLAAMALLVFSPMFRVNTIFKVDFSLFDEVKSYLDSHELPKKSTYSVIPITLATVIGLFTFVECLRLVIESFKFFGQNRKIEYYNAIRDSGGDKTYQDKKFASYDSFSIVVATVIIYIVGILLAHYLDKPDAESILTTYYDSFVYMTGVNAYNLILPILMVGLCVIIHFYRMIVYNNIRYEIYDECGYNDYDDDYDDEDDDYDE